MKTIQVISTFADDFLKRIDLGTTEKREGGPALWITRTLEEAGKNFSLVTSADKAVVEIRIAGDHEEGKIISVPKISVSSICSADLTIISTISNEFNLNVIPTMDGLIALDIQGFIRKRREVDGPLKFQEKVAEKIAILKATEQELRFIDPVQIENQKKRILLVTKGKDGFEIYFNEKLFSFASNRIESLTDTIGAGDVLLAAFSTSYIDTDDVIVSAEYARSKVESYLLQKRSQVIASGQEKDILILASVHGNEPIGLLLVRRLLASGRFRHGFDWIVANPLAALRNRRYVDVDLNRVAPGDPDAPEYERRRAAELRSTILKHKYVIDIHQTRANSRTIIILPNPSTPSLTLALHSSVRDIILWPAPPDKKEYSLAQQNPYSIGLEIGTKSGMPSALKRAEGILFDLISTLERGSLTGNLVDLAKGKRFYLVYGKIEPHDVVGQTLKDFKKVKTPAEDFTALLFGRHQKILGYKMKEVGLDWVMDYIERQPNSNNVSERS